MSPALDSALARAYDLDQVQSNSTGAVADIKAVLAQDADLAKEAIVERDRLAQVVAARESGGQHGDHASLILSRLLNAALAEGEVP